VDDSSDWTVDILRTHLMAIFEEREKRYNQRFTDLETALRAALAASEKAIIKAETATERRFDSVNEFRQTLTDQAAQFLTRDVFDVEMKTLRERHQEITNQLSISAGKGAGLHMGWLILAAAVPMIASIIAVVLALSRM
jgi:hypothetical protein